MMILLLIVITIFAIFIHVMIKKLLGQLPSTYSNTSYAKMGSFNYGLTVIINISY